MPDDDDGTLPVPKHPTDQFVDDLRDKARSLMIDWLGSHRDEIPEGYISTHLNRTFDSYVNDTTDELIKWWVFSKRPTSR